MFQSYNLIPNLSAKENVMLPMEFAGVPQAERSKRAVELLNQVELTEECTAAWPTGSPAAAAARRHCPGAGQQPKLILADEPTGNLDDETGELIIALLRQLAHQQKTTILVVTHDQALAGQTDRKFRLARGQITED